MSIVLAFPLACSELGHQWMHYLRDVAGAGWSRFKQARKAVLENVS